MAPARQQRLQKGAARWQKMDKRERADAAQRMQRWKALPKGDRQLLRKRFKRFNQLPLKVQQRRMRQHPAWR